MNESEPTNTTNFPSTSLNIDYLRLTVIRPIVLVVQWLGVGLALERSLVRLPAGALSSQLGQLSLPSLRGRYIEYQPARLNWVRRCAFTCVGWKVTLCDPIWQVTSRSSEMGFPPRKSYIGLYLYLLLSRSQQ